MTEVLLSDAGGAFIKVMDVGNGVTMPPFHSGQQYFDGIPNYEIRDDDVMLLSFTKTGENVNYWYR